MCANLLIGRPEPVTTTRLPDRVSCRKAVLPSLSDHFERPRRRLCYWSLRMVTTPCRHEVKAAKAVAVTGFRKRRQGVRTQSGDGY